jgi:hypothetical protein
MKRTMIAITALVIACQATAGPQWTWEAGKQTNNGSIVVKSVSGSTTYNVTQNPTGAVAKTNQSASTQPPTVIIQATGGGTFFNYGDNCYVFYPPQGMGYPSQNTPRIGMGKLSGSDFTGIIAYYQGMGAATIIGQMTGVSAPGNGNTSYLSGYFYWCGSDASCAWYSASGTVGGYNYNVVGVASLPVVNAQKCYP